MSLRLVSSLTRIASPVVRRNPNSAVIGQAFSMSSNTSENPPKPPKAAVKVRHQTPEVSPGSVEKGDTYKAGETYFSFNPYSFYDFEKEMQPKRLEQPCSSDKAS